LDLDLAQLRQWIGRTMAADDIVTPRLVAEYRATLDPNLAPVDADEAPLALHWCLAPTITPLATLGPDGHGAKGEFLPPVPLPRRMWAGGSIEFQAPLRIGDQVRRRSTIGDVTVKEGRTGTLCFVSVDHEYSTRRGPALRERHDIVYRETTGAAPKPAGAAEAAEPRQADITRHVEATPTLLFRYSAMTFNGHRIHYDHPYVTAVEGYAGLVVHGPMQATLMFNLAAELGGGVPRTFRYRGVSPLIAGQRFAVRGRRDAAGGIHCWTEDAQGKICMESEST
jgi:3-methylfumaryl-CoA hydratase